MPESNTLDAKKNLLQEILSLIKIMEDSCLKFYTGLTTDSEEDCQLLFNDLEAGIVGLKQCYASVKSLLNHACYYEMVENIEYTLAYVADLINREEDYKASVKLKYQLYPFLQELWEEIYYWGIIYPDSAAMSHYYQKEFASHHFNPSLNNVSPNYKLSIFIPVYNKLEYTRQCIDSILANTDLSKYSYEFILLNDGSTDGTQEYFESLNIDKIIELKRNVKTMIFSLAMRVCEGEYLVFVNNDTLVTKGWLDNLLTCIESDPAIISATPCTPNTSNYQSDIDGRFSFSSVQEVMRHMNRSNPSLWEERIRIMPVIAMYRSKLVNQIGLADRLFYTMEFWDDDFSLRARRAGYKQMLCRDTYCHHFGSVTGREGQVKENTLEKGRKLFLLKNHLDAWGEDFCFNYQIRHFVQLSPLPSSGNYKTLSNREKIETANILGIDCGFGDTFLQIKSHIISKKKEPILYTISTEDRYDLYSKKLSDHHTHTDSLLKAVKDLTDKKFDYIYIQKPLEAYSDHKQLLSLLNEKLNQGGLLLFSATNIYYKPFLENLLKLSFPEDSDKASFLNLAALQSYLKEIFSNMECIAQSENICDVDTFKDRYLIGGSSLTPSFLLSAKYLRFCCRK